MRRNVTNVAQNAKIVATAAVEGRRDVRIKINHQAVWFSCKRQQSKFQLQNKFLRIDFDNKLQGKLFVFITTYSKRQTLVFDL